MFLTQDETYWYYDIVGTRFKLVYNFRKKYLMVVDKIIQREVKAFDGVHFRSIKDFEQEGRLYFLGFTKSTFGVN
jgi:hypothetical protein